jgi:hypothetical protein
MAAKVYVLEVEIDGRDGLIVSFSDGTTDPITVEELLALRPLCEPVRKPKRRNHPNL